MNVKKENTIITHFVELDQTLQTNIKNSTYNFLISKGYSIQKANEVVENLDRF